MPVPRPSFSQQLINAVDGRLQQESRIAPYFPSSSTVVEHMLDMADLTPSDVLYDLGSGDGRILQAACQRGVARAVGIELDEHLAAHSRQILSKEIEADQVRVVTGDCRHTPMEDATVVTVYMGSVGSGLLQPIVERLAPNVRIIVHDYPFDDRWPHRQYAEGSTVVPVAEGGIAQGEEEEHRLSYELFLYSTQDLTEV